MGGYLKEELLEFRDLVARTMLGDRAAWGEGLDELYFRIVHQTPSFDWSNWNKGLQGLKNAGAPVYDSNQVYDAEVESNSFEEFDQDELGKLLLMIIRVNRFSDEFYDEQIENGVILKILDRLIEINDR